MSPAKRRVAPAKSVSARSTRAKPAPATDGGELLATAERLLEKVKGVEAEIYLETHATVGAEIEGGGLGSTSAQRHFGGAWRLIEAKRTGFAYFTRLQDAVQALETARTSARHATPNDFTLPTPKRAKKMTGRWDDEVATLDPSRAVALAMESLQAAKGLHKGIQVPGGGAGMSWGRSAVANTHGVAFEDAMTECDVGVSVTFEDASGTIAASESQSRHTLADAAHVGVLAGERALSLRKPRSKRPTGAKDVVLSPEAASELVLNLAIGAAVGDEAMRNRSVWSGKLGKTVAHKGFSIVDDPWLEGALGASGVDDEGVVSKRLPIVESGVLCHYLYDAWDAAKHNAKPTGNASRGSFKSRPGTSTNHIVLTSTRTRSLDKLIADVDDGYVVDSVLGAHTANGVTGDFSVTAPNVWRIENGERIHAVKEVALSGNLPELLGRVGGVSKEVRRSFGSVVPYVLLRGLQISA